jgi:small subunit ribosomal protein S20
VAHSLSAKKRIRQNENRRVRNQSRKSAIKTQIRKFEDAMKANDVGTAEEQLRLVTKKLDQGANTSALHKNTAARKKSRLARRLNAAKTKATA